MKIRLERDVLAEAVQWAARSLPVRPSVPILAGLLVRADADGVTFSSFDYETSAQISVKAEVTDEGQALISGRLLSDISRSLPAKPVDISSDDIRMELVCGSARFTLQTLPVADYPTLPSMPESTGAVPSDVVRPGRRPGRRRRRPRRAAAGLHRRPGRDRGRHHLAAGHRPLPDGAQGAHLEPELDPGLGHRAGPGQGAERHRPLDDRRRGGHPQPGQRRVRRRDHRLRGPRRGRGAADHDPAAGRRVPQGPPHHEHRRRDERPGQHRRGASPRPSGSRWSPSATPRCGC